MSDLFNALLNMDYTPQEAREEIEHMTARVYHGENPEEVLYEIGLEPDYVLDLLI